MDLFAAAVRDGLIKLNNDNKSNQLNSNQGTNGTNLQYDQAQGNRGKQLNPNQTPNLMNDENDLDNGDVYWYSGINE
ncbi:MAG: hypothetical protein PHF42_09495 [Pseudomonas sp.]|nr:hypothetical protein [Pseudomonas sp.]